ncbi:MAG TPA: ATP synthase F1 subunit delta [Spirochaetota bacterium]|jgi:F-type H+-transporting ATPase subunit delta|nr:ATP synthase F1 subunit delta [Spirochaetota bacterium]HQO21531.1 ATP synthase F1 subunit delta [Spirochaetota bacterium]HQQ22631.1 ATP synthase F1 subunit delta [Spirochaetota bacterium]
MERSLISKRYAKALCETAVKLGKLDEVSGGILFFTKKILSDRKLMDFLSSSAVSPSAKKAFIEDNRENLSSLLSNCFNIMIDNGRFSLFEKVCFEWNIYEKKQRKIITVKIITSSELSERNNGQIMNFIRKLHPDCKYEIYSETDPSILGGFILKIDNIIYDYSVSGSLDRMKNHIMNSSV